MDIRAHVVALNEKRAGLAKELNDHIDACHNAHPGEVMTGEERQKEERIQAAIDEIEAEVKRFVDREQNEREGAELRDAAEAVFGTSAVKAQDERNARTEDKFRAWALNPAAEGDFVLEGISAYANLRNRLREQGLRGADLRNALYTDTGSIGSAVPTIMAQTLYEYMEASISMFRAPTTKITTSTGEDRDFPTLSAHSIGTQVIAQGTAIGGTDPGFDKLTLGAYRYGQLVHVGNDSLQDTVFDLAGFLGANMGRGLGRQIDTHLVTGNGSTAPQGIMGAGWGSIATGGSLITVDYENLVDMVYSVDEPYLTTGSAGWLMKRATAGSIRKFRDGAGGTTGAVLWEPSLTAGIQDGEPDRLLGYPVYTDPNVASQGSAAKAVWFGDFSAYHIRQVGDVQIERSSDYRFNTDETSFRAKWRVDGDVIDTNAGVVSHQVP